MTIGFDVSKPTQGQIMPYGCLVATMDLKKDFGFFATTCRYSNPKSLSKEFSICVEKAIIAYREKYEVFPNKLVIYRGNNGTDMLYIRDMEVKILEEKLKKMYGNISGRPFELIFITVTKMIQHCNVHNE